MSQRNARLTVFGRRLLVDRVRSGRPVAHVAAEMGVSRITAHKWVRRWRTEGEAGLHDRFSRPRTTPHRRPRLAGHGWLHQAREHLRIPADLRGIALDGTRHAHRASHSPRVRVRPQGGHAHLHLRVRSAGLQDWFDGPEHAPGGLDLQLVTDQGDCEIAEYNQALTYAGSPSAEILWVTGCPQGLRWCVHPGCHGRHGKVAFLRRMAEGRRKEHAHGRRKAR